MTGRTFRVSYASQTGGRMATVTDQVITKPEAKRRNWWKVGFFVMLIAFELARELVVVNAAEGAIPSAGKYVSTYGNLLTATGSWQRSDGGSPIVSSTVKIDCFRDTSLCIEAQTTSNEKYFHVPSIDIFPATFSGTSVSYTNDNPDCARYSVLIDAKTERAIATRERKENPKNDFCKKLEKRIAMELGSSWDRPSTDPTKEHFVPLLQLVLSLVKLFD